MGAFFGNVHVQARSGSESDTHALILSRIRELAKKEGLVEATEGAEATRTILVGPPGAWVGVYDSATEVEPSQVAALARTLTRATDWRAIGALVHDSDHLFVFLYEAGKKLDEIGNKKKGRVERWQGLVDRERLPALEKAFKRDDLLVEETLCAIGEVLGIDAGGIATGCKYLLEDDGATPEGATALRFRPAEVPEHERPATGPSRFGARSWNNRTLGALGDSITLHACVHNAGGPSRGLSFIVHGPAVEAKLIEPESAALCSQQAWTEQLSFARKTLNNGREGYVADFVDYAIPPAIGRDFTKPDGVSPEDWIRKLQQDGVDLLRHQQRCMTSDISGRVTARAASVGTAPVYLSFVPIEAREGQFHFGEEITIITRHRPPLRATTHDAQSLSDLQTPDVLVAFAVSTLERSDAAVLAADAIERWATVWPEGELTSAIFFDCVGGPPRKPKTSPLHTKAFATSAAWRKLRTAMASERRVSARGDLRHERGQAGSARDACGFEFGSGIGVMTSATDVELPTLRLTVDLRGRTDGEALYQMALSVVDDFVVRAKCAQAFVARWGRAGGIESTPYESVCGVSGQCTFRRSWQTRFLRAVSADGMWLGPALMERVDHQGLERVAVTKPVGETLHVVLREGRSMDELEQILAPILASREEWQQGMDWMYGRRDTMPGS
jgi:hypothetical protein